MTPQIGITSTPVIDPSAGPNGIIYVVAMSKTTTGTTTYFHRIHALDMTTGAEELGGPVTVTATFSPGPAFKPAQYKERAGFLLLNGDLDYHLGLALRRLTVQRLDHGLQSEHAGANLGSGYHSERQ